jgi:hypothetical protein
VLRARRVEPLWNPVPADPGAARCYAALTGAVPFPVDGLKSCYGTPGGGTHRCR